MDEASNNTLTGNQISNNTESAIYVETSKNIIASNNNLFSNKYGARLYVSTLNTFSNNNITNHTYGIYRYKSENNTLTGNQFSNNT